MKKLIVKMGGCSEKKKGIGLQFDLSGGQAKLTGSIKISGDSMVESPDPLPSDLEISPEYFGDGCCACGSKYVYRCGGCSRLICYEGGALENAKCPLCGSVGSVPAYQGKVESSSASPIDIPEAQQLRQGQPISFIFDSDKLYVGVGWAHGKKKKDRMDIDASVIVAGGGKYEVVYFGNQDHPSGCIHHYGDNMTGSGNLFFEVIYVDLATVPADRNALYFVVNIFEDDFRKRTFEEVKSLRIRIDDARDRTQLVEYLPQSNFEESTAIVIGVLKRKGDRWVFRAIGEGSNATNVYSLADEIVRKY